MARSLTGAAPNRWWPAVRRALDDVAEEHAAAQAAAQAAAEAEAARKLAMLRQRCMLLPGLATADTAQSMAVAAEQQLPVAVRPPAPACPVYQAARVMWAFQVACHQVG